MKKLAAAAICAATALALTGCGNVPTKSEEPSSGRFFADRDSSTICTLLTDSDTGCQYLFVTCGNGGSAITPLLNADGTPYVEAEVKSL